MMMKKTETLIKNNPLFESTALIDQEMIGYMLSQKTFSKETRKSLTEKLHSYPIPFPLFFLVQQILKKRFQNILSGKWMEGIV